MIVAGQGESQSSNTTTKKKEKLFDGGGLPPIGGDVRHMAMPVPGAVLTRLLADNAHIPDQGGRKVPKDSSQARVLCAGWRWWRW